MTTTRTHTPGPWRAELREAACPRVLATDGRNTIICAVSGASSNRTVEGDARLIAAAPDLLDALIWCAQEVQSRISHSAECDCLAHSRLNRAHAALAKALGGSFDLDELASVAEQARAAIAQALGREE